MKILQCEYNFIYNGPLPLQQQWIFLLEIFPHTDFYIRYLRHFPATAYTSWVKKTPMLSFCVNFGTYGPILIILSPLHSAMNSRRSFYIICHLTSNLLPHYLAKFKCLIVQAYRIVTRFKRVRVVYFQWISTGMSWSRSYVYADSFPVLHHVFKISAISKQACFESWAPAVNGCVDDAFSMVSQVSNRCCRNLLRWCDVRWGQWHSEKTIKLCVDYPGWYVWTAVKLNIEVLQGDAATCLRRGGKFYSILSLQFISESKNERITEIGTSYHRKTAWVFFLTRGHNTI